MKKSMAFGILLLLFSLAANAQRQPVTDVIMGFDGETRSMDVFTYLPFSSSNISWNYDDSELMPVYWDRGHNDFTEIQYKIDFNWSALTDIGWTTLVTTRNIGIELPLDDNSVYPNFPNMSSGGVIYFRLRNVSGSSVSPWAYINPLDVYFSS